jgi:hypothetical protein
VSASALHFLGGNVADPDLWDICAMADAILDGHGLPPREDVFSYAPRAPFYDHEWLSDLVFAVPMRSAVPGLVSRKLLVCARCWSHP